MAAAFAQVARRASASSGPTMTEPPVRVTSDVLRERAERLLAENTDLHRRIKDKDERNAELQKMVTAVQQRGAKTAEALSVEQAERRNLEEAVKRWESSAEDYKGELGPLQVRADKAERHCLTLQAQLDSATKQVQAQLDSSAKQVEQLQDALAAARREITQTSEQAQRSEARVMEAREEAHRREKGADDRMRQLEGQLEALRAESTRMYSALTAAETEARLNADAMARLGVQAEAERASLRELLAAGQSRLDISMAAQREEMAAKERALAQASVAQAERRLLGELSSRVQEQLMHERAAFVALRGEREAEKREFSSALDTARAELIPCRERLATLEAERQALHQRLGHLEGQLRASLDDGESRSAELRSLIDTCSKQNEELVQLRQAMTVAADERTRAAGLREARDVAEEGRVKAQEQLAAMAERLQAADERRRSIEKQLEQSQAKQKAEARWEAKFHEAERERTKAQEALIAANNEARAIAEREQVLLHRLALRERLGQLDWSRGAAVVDELRATHVGVPPPASKSPTASPPKLAGSLYATGAPWGERAIQ